jgi:hypothetical protein
MWNPPCSFYRSMHAQPAGAAPQRAARSGQMIACLRRSFLYSEKKARDILFRVVESILASNKVSADRIGVILSRLTREAAQRAAEEAERIAYQFSNWEVASRAVLNSMLHAGVLLSHDGSTIHPGISAHATPIAGLKEGFEDITEAHLLEFLVRTLGDVSVRDHRALAHALFRQFDPNVLMYDLEDRVVLLLATLSRSVVLHPDGSYAVRSEIPQSTSLTH